MGTYLPALGLTLGAELLTVGLLLLALRRPAVRLLVCVLTANLATHPTFWFLFARVGRSVEPEPRLWAWEVGVTLAEGLVYATVGRARPIPLAWGLAIAANLVSFWAGIFWL